MAAFTWRAAPEQPGLPAGRYACDPVDQHSMAWCGACYLIAAITVVEDRAHIALTRRYSPHRCVLRPLLSRQLLLDHYQEPAGPRGWNGCLGGFSLHVLRCLTDGTCPLMWERGAEAQREWWSFPRWTRERCLRAEVESVTLTNPRRVPPSEVRGVLQREGPVILEVSAETLKDLDAQGRAVDLAPRDPNHAVAVVGWQRDCWVVRNSWGTRKVPRAIPRDAEDCVGRGHNSCVVEWEEWTGTPEDPGFVLLPMSYAPLHARHPSPWVSVTVS